MDGEADGEVFGRYRLLGVLRWGGMGPVYRARDTVMAREVAIKILPPEQDGEPGQQERFRREVSVAARLNSPNIIPVYEAGEIDGRSYLAMPVLDGIDLDSLIRRDGPMSPVRAVRLIEQAAMALQVAHGSGLVHGDVQPPNLFVVGGDFVYLVGFGVVADAQDPRGDIHALGGVLQTCLTGRPTDLGGALPELPAQFVKVIARATAERPDDRYQSALELAVAAREALTQTAAAVGPPAQDTDFGRYRLLEQLGTGGMGTVYRAHDSALDRYVAVKVLKPELAVEPGYQERFRREAHAAGRLASPHIIPIYEAGEVDGRLFLAMPIVDGVDVHTMLDRDGPMSPQRAVRVVEQAAAALDTAHQAGLVHRDVKPSNLLMVGEDFVYLIDFGLVHEPTAVRLTRTNVAPGSPPYMAPERFQVGRSDDLRVDVYALACALYECLTGRLPFSGGGVQGLAVAHMSSEPPRPSAFDPAIPSGFDQVIARGMAKDPDHRYQSASELAVAARAALTSAVPEQARVWTDSTHPALPAQTPPGRKRRRLAIAAAASVLVVLVAAAVVGYHHFTSERSPAQLVLPFTGLDRPLGVAVDTHGNVFVTDSGHNRVLKLAAGSAEQVVVPFAGLDHPASIAVDDNGGLDVTEPANNRVLELAAGSTEPTVLPFTGLDGPMDVTVTSRDPRTNRAVLVADTGNNRVLELTARSIQQRELPFTGLTGPSAVAVGTDRDLFVIDRDNERVLKLPWTATVATVLPYLVGRPDDLAIGAADDLYVIDSRYNRVLRLDKSSNTPITLSFNGLNGPRGIAVDGAGNVYVADSGNNRVLKLPAS